MPENAPRLMSGGQALVACLHAHGVRHVFNVPGESYLAALDAFYDYPDIQLITNRQEGGACYMAEAYGKATRTPGVCFVTRGPGATNASIGVHCAAQDSTPLVLFVGQVPRVNRGREAFQEIDYERFFGSIAKWVVEIDKASKVPEVVTRAMYLARSGRPGPVVVSLPEDMLVETAEMTIPAPIPLGRSRPDPELILEMAARLNGAKRPVVLAGSGVQYAGARGTLVRFAEHFQVPVVTSWRRNDAFPNSHGNYAGTLAISKTPAQELAASADVLLVVGDRLGEITTNNYAFPTPGQTLMQIDVDAGVIGQNFPPQLAIVADAGAALEEALKHGGPEGEGRSAWIAGIHQAMLEHAAPHAKPSDKVDMEGVMADLREGLPPDAILTVDAGNASAWVQRFFNYQAEDSLLGPTVGSMGYGLPAAIAAKLAHPERTVIGTCGDGAFMMTVQELATAVQYGVNIIQLVINNGALGTIRMHQEREYPGRIHATDLHNPDFAELARAHGAHGYTVEKGEDFLPALREAMSARAPAVIEIRTDLEQISVAATISDLRARHAAKGR